MEPDRDRGRLAAPGERADRHPVRLPECLHPHSVAALAVLAGTDVVRILEGDRIDRALGTKGSMTSADVDACSSAFSSSGSKRTKSPLAISYPLTVSSRGTIPLIGHSRRVWILELHRAWSRWKATPFQLVAVNSWTGLDRNGGEAERAVDVLQGFKARGIVFESRRSRRALIGSPL